MYSERASNVDKLFSPMSAKVFGSLAADSRGEPHTPSLGVRVAWQIDSY